MKNKKCESIKLIFYWRILLIIKVLNVLFEKMLEYHDIHDAGWGVGEVFIEKKNFTKIGRENKSSNSIN